MSPTERVTRFCTAVAEWERQTFAGMTSGKNSVKDCDAARALLSAIYEDNLTEKAKGPKKWGMRLAGPVSGNPPQYDQEVTGEEPGPRSSSYVFTKHRTLPKMLWRYSVVTAPGGDPRIDELRVRAGESTDWKPGMY
jgi:hypothetical protein